jgi:hypothetical protein
LLLRRAGLFGTKRNESEEREFMKKISLLFMAVMIAVLAGCAGDTTDPTGDLPTVQQLVLDATSTGRTIVLTWSAVTESIDGYKIYFKADAAGSFVEVGESTTTTYTHTATVAGTYAVMAYQGTNYSAAYSNEVSTMPNIIATTYTIYDNYSPADKPSGFIFGPSSGQTGSAASPSFVQDIYAYDESKGDADVWLYSGNFGTFGNGNQSYFQEPLANGYCDPSGVWYSTSYRLLTGDSVVFVELPWNSGQSAYVKMYDITVAPDPDSNNGTMVSFKYEYQSEILGLTVFTSSN